MRNKHTRTVAGAAAVSLMALPLAGLAAVATAGPAQADTTRHGSCAGGTYEFQVEREDGGWEASIDLDRVAPGSRWTLVIKHDGRRAALVHRTADREGDVDLDVTRRDTAGKDVFRFKAKSGSGTICRGAITVS